MALKIYLDTESPDQFLQTSSFPSQKNQDFLSSSSQTFLAPDINAYSSLFARRSKGGFAKASIAITHPGLTWKRLIAPLFRNRNNAPVLLEKTFWSELPFTWGDQAAKFRFTPCHDFQRGDLPEEFMEDSDYQRHSIEELLSRQNICYNLEVQLRRRPSPLLHGEDLRSILTPIIEDATLVWSTDRDSYRTVAKLTILREAPSLTKQECETLSFNPWNGLKDHQPLGSLNRARLAVYGQSALTRKDFTGGESFTMGVNHSS